MPDQLIQYSVDRGVARIALDSPRNRNALSATLVQQLTEALTGAGTDDSVRAIELTHTGSTFCAGADLSEASRGGMKAGAERVITLLKLIVTLPKPVVGSIDGHVRAGGLGLVGACDIVLAGPASTFAFTEVKLGLAAAMISLTTLPKMNPRAASRYYLTGEKFDAPTAARIGLITEAVDDIDAGTQVVLEALRAASPQGLRETKPLLTPAVLDGFAARADALAELSARLFASAEAAEGMAAFLEKRSPSWATG
jgi:enoyl-CoA hydratase